MQIETVIQAVRTRLGDVKEQRWDTNTLALYTSLCQQDICIYSKLYKKDTYIELTDDSKIYTLPTDFLQLHRVEYKGNVIPIENRYSIDAKDAQLPCIVRDNLKFNQLEFITDNSNDTLQSALDSAFGVVTTDDELEDAFGVVTDISYNYTPPEVNPNSLHIYYSAVPPISYDITTELVLPDIWLSAFLHYVTGMALQDDNDANNIQRGEMELKKYSRHLKELFTLNTKQFTSSTPDRLEVKQRRI